MSLLLETMFVSAKDSKNSFFLSLSSLFFVNQILRFADLLIACSAINSKALGVNSICDVALISALLQNSKYFLAVSSLEIWLYNIVL